MRLIHTMRMETADEILVRQTQTGDADAFAALVERHYDMIFRVAFAMLGNRTDAEDVAQDVATSLAGKIASFRAEAKFTTWLYRVTTNAATDRLRKRQSRRRANHGWGDAELFSQSAREEKRAELDWLNQAMAALPHDLRQTVALVLGEEMTHAQAAEALSLSEGTVSWRMSEVKKCLRGLAKKEDRI